MALLYHLQLENFATMQWLITFHHTQYISQKTELISLQDNFIHLYEGGSINVSKRHHSINVHSMEIPKYTFRGEFN